jgi:hypothetical protein
MKLTALILHCLLFGAGALKQMGAGDGAVVSTNVGVDASGTHRVAAAGGGDNKVRFKALRTAKKDVYESPHTFGY